MRWWERLLASFEDAADRQDGRRRRQLSTVSARGRDVWGIAAEWSCAGGHEAMSGQDVVCQGEPEQCGFYLVNAANGELAQAPLSEAGVDAFMHGASLVDALAMWAPHAPPPGGHPGPIFGSRRIGVAVVLALGGWSVDKDALAGRPLGVVVLVEAAVDQLAPRHTLVARAQPLERGPQQAAIRARGVDADIDHDLAVGDGAELAIVGRPEAAIRHLHDTRLGIGGRDTRLLLLGDLLLVGLGTALPLGLDLGQLAQCCRHPFLALARRPLGGCLDAPVAGVGILVDLALQALDQAAGLLQVLVQALAATQRCGSRTAPNTHPALDDPGQLDHAGRPQAGDVVRQELINSSPWP